MAFSLFCLLSELEYVYNQQWMSWANGLRSQNTPTREMDLELTDWKGFEGFMGRIRQGIRIKGSGNRADINDQWAPIHRSEQRCSSRITGFLVEINRIT